MLFNKKGVKNCFGLLLVLSIIFLSLSNACLDVSAVNRGYNSFGMAYYSRIGSGNIQYSTSIPYDVPHYNIASIRTLSAQVSAGDTVPQNATHLSLSGKFNLVTYIEASLGNPQDYLPTISNTPTLSGISINNLPADVDSTSVNYYVTDWWGQPLGNTAQYYLMRTYTFEYSFIVGANLPSTINNLAFSVDFPNSLLSTQFYDGFVAYFEYDPNNYVSYDFAYDRTSALLLQQTQLQSITNNNLESIYNDQKEYQDANYEAVDNIGGQSASDLDVGTGSYTNLIGLLQGFVVMLQTPRIINCELTLPFPNFAGGSVTVNPCSFKEKAPAIVQWGSSLLLVTFFIPFAFMVLRLIYNEIRSWTNG